jgi:hypothetical protein
MTIKFGGDVRKSIERWENEGGRGILHATAKSPSRVSLPKKNAELSQNEVAGRSCHMDGTIETKRTI